MQLDYLLESPGHFFIRFLQFCDYLGVEGHLIVQDGHLFFFGLEVRLVFFGFRLHGEVSDFFGKEFSSVQFAIQDHLAVSDELDYFHV